jgi:hypothetical protein
VVALEEEVDWCAGWANEKRGCVVGCCWWFVGGAVPKILPLRLRWELGLCPPEAARGGRLDGGMLGLLDGRFFLRGGV